MRWFARTEQLLGNDGFARLQKARVGIYGLGGVGGFACEALARAGVGHLRLVDHDVVGGSNLNRQILALRSTLGEPKVEVAAKRVMDINPHCEVDTRQVFLNGETLLELLDDSLDIVVDAIDSVNCKAGLLEAAYHKGIPVVSSMGAGGKQDMGQIQASDLSKSIACPLARMIRKRLSKRGIREGIRCVFSPEPCRNDLLPDPQDVDVQNGPGRQRTPLGTISYMPAAFGLRVAQEVIDILLRAAPLSELPVLSLPVSDTELG